MSSRSVTFSNNPSSKDRKNDIFSITNFMYNSFEIFGDDIKLYVSYFPPATDTTYSPFVCSSNDTDNIPNTNELPTVEEMKNFWTSREERQVDGKYKGGWWGPNNFPPSNPSWINGSKIGDKINIINYKEGIIKALMGIAFTDSSEIIPNTEKMALTINFEWNNKVYSGYLTNNPMPQEAVDCLVTMISSNHDVSIRFAKRGVEGPFTDIPDKLLVGGGETVEPDSNGFKFNAKSNIARALREELQLDMDSFPNPIIYELGIYEDKDRDPRYFKYSVLCDDDNIKYFGIDRKSRSRVYLVIIKTDKIPKNYENDFDSVEIAKVYWTPFNLAYQKSVNEPGAFMIPEHTQYLKEAIPYIRANF
uniref:Uncharacterized protein n=1 Tax=viral metagenome TaxID=1070528 RepID=A0A6C0BEL6_9ZZZZ